MESDDYEYHWDNDPNLKNCLVRLNSLDDLGKIRINGLNAKELLNNQKIDLKIRGEDKNLSTGLVDKFGEIIIQRGDEIIRKIRLAPWKLSKGKGSPKEVYDFVANDIFEDINSFLSYILKSIQTDIKSIDNFSYHLLNEFPQSYDFLVNLLDYSNRLLETSLIHLYHSGPINKEVNVKQGYSGSQLVLSSLVNPSPYNLYMKKQHTHDTLLNHMIFQASYFMMQASILVEEHLDKKHTHLKDNTKYIFKNSRKLLNEYNLWSFFNLEILDDSQIRSKLISQNNKFYIKIYQVFRIVRDIIVYLTLIAPLHLEKGIEMALLKFYTIYEIWSLTKLCKHFKNKGFIIESLKIGSFNLMKAKLFLILKKEDIKVEIIWELRLNPITHSTYYGSLVNNSNIKVSNPPIKPDITIKLDSKKFKKVLIGDVKFSLREDSSLPELDSLYNVLSYLEDLKKSPLFKGAEVGGLLIYPGEMLPLITPQIDNENYITITPLNMFSQDFGMLI